jgi:hypothetical protein
VLRALDAPDDVERARGQHNLLGIGAIDAVLSELSAITTIRKARGTQQ